MWPWLCSGTLKDKGAGRSPGRPHTGVTVLALPGVRDAEEHGLPPPVMLGLCSGSPVPREVSCPRPRLSSRPCSLSHSPGLPSLSPAGHCPLWLGDQPPCSRSWVGRAGTWRHCLLLEAGEGAGGTGWACVLVGSSSRPSLRELDGP